MAAKLKKGDTVIVLAGKDKGRQGEITLVNIAANKAIVSGINVFMRHRKQTQNSQGGRIPTDMPIALSNLALIDPKQGGATRVGFRYINGKKRRFAKKSETIIDG